MLVLQRKLNEKIILPGIDTAIQIVAIKPGTVRLGIDAPADVAVFREEVLRQIEAQQPAEHHPENRGRSTSRKLIHDVRNKLNAASIGMALLKRQLQAGMTDDMSATLTRMAHEQQELQKLIEELGRPAQPQRPRATRKALLVEDDQNECELLAGFLRMAGLDVATAGDGCDALDYLKKSGRPDVVLLDMVLPRCDGLTAAKAIRQDPANAGMKIFAVSGHNPENLHVDQRSAGIDRWFHKPLNPEQLLQELQKALTTTD